MLFQREILEHIAQYLSPKDQYQCLTVCQSWYYPFRHFLYRVIHITTDKQLKQLQYALLIARNNPGFLVRQIYLQEKRLLSLGMGVHLTETKPLEITQEFLDCIDQNCPLIQLLNFDQSQWSSLSNTCLPQGLLYRLKHLPKLNYSHMENILPMLSTTTATHYDRLTRLHVRGNIDMLQFNNHNNNSDIPSSSIIQSLSLMSHLTQLVFERDDLHNKYKTPIVTLEHINLIHRTLPLLSDLQFINHFNFGASSYYHDDGLYQQRYTQLQSLKLEGTLQSYQWIQYVSQVYPSLKSLSLDLVHSPFSSLTITGTTPMQYINFKIKESFSIIAEHYKHLELIRIRGLSSPLWLTPQFMDSLQKKSLTTVLDAQLYGLDGNEVEKAVDLLTNHDNSTTVDLIGLRLPIWKNINSNITWKETVQPLSKFKELVRLELDAVSMSFFAAQHQVDNNSGGASSSGFELDTILKQLTSLKSLKLSCSTVQLSGAIITRQQPHPLTELNLNKMSFSPLIMTYLSANCLGLKRLILYDCQQQPQHQHESTRRVDIRLPNISLDLLVLYRVRHPYQIVQSRAPGARYLSFNDNSWFHLVEEEEKLFTKSLDKEKNKIKAIIESSSSTELFAEEEWDPNRAQYHTGDEWLQDIPFGYIQLNCQAAKSIFFDDYCVV